MIAGFLVTSALAADPAKTPTFGLRLVVEPVTTNSEPMTIEYAGRPSEIVTVEKDNVLDTHAIKSAAVVKDQLGQPAMEITLTEAGGKAFGEFTKNHLGKRLVMVINGRACSAPVIQTPILDGRLRIHGNFTLQEAKDFVAGINGATK